MVHSFLLSIMSGLNRSNARKKARIDHVLADEILVEGQRTSADAIGELGLALI